MKIPRYVSEKYFNGARDFKSEKRQQLKVLLKALDDFRCGCAYLPSGSRDVQRIAEILQRVQSDISTKNWGR